MHEESLLTIACDGVVAHARARGASLCDLTVRGAAVIPADTPLARSKWFHGVSLAPWPNRLQDGVWEHDGQTLRGALNDPRGHALHGLVAERAFDVVAHDERYVRFAVEIVDEPVYPWRMRIEVEYVADSDGLACSISAVNLSDHRVPVGLGVHPYFAFDNASGISVPARSVCANNERLIPTGELLPISSVGLRSADATPLAGLALDDCFTGLMREGDGNAHTRITRPDGCIDVWQDQSLGYVQVFTLPEFPWADTQMHGVAIEPQSAPANALQTGQDLRWLASGEQWTARWGIKWTSGG